MVKTKINKINQKKIEKMIDKAAKAIDELSSSMNSSENESENNELNKREITFSASKPISKIKKGDKLKIDGRQYEVDAHYVLIDHGSTKEMAIEIFDDSDKDFQLRYFDDQAESTLDFYELQEIMYFKKPFKKIEW